MKRRKDKPTTRGKKSALDTLSSDQVRQLFFAKCTDKEHLKEWVKMFWGVHLPGKIVSRYSTSSPLESVWEMYSHALYLKKGIDVLYIAPRGGGKCCEAGTLIPVKNCGLKKIEDIQVGDLVNSGVDWNPVLQTFNEGVKQGYGITTKNGISLVGSINHRVMVASKDLGIDWKHVSDVTTNDFVYCTGDSSINIDEGDFNDGWLVGAIVGDGSIVDTVKNRRVDFCSGDEKVANLFCQLMLQKFNKTPRTWQNSENSKGYQVNSVALINWLHEYIDGRLAYDKKLKSLNHSDSFLAGFLVGLFDTDGSHDEICLANLPLIQQISQLLTKFNVFNRVHENRKKPRYSQFTKGMVSYHSVHFISKVPEFLLPIGTKRDRFRDESNKRREQYRYPSITVEFFIKALREEYQLSNGWMLLDGEKVRVQLPFPDDICQRSTFIEGHKIAAWSLWAAKMGLYDLSAQLMLVHTGYFQKVVSTFEKETTFFDLEVDTDHSYISNGILSHNTLGVAISESLMMFHDRRGVVHIGAIEKQAKRAYGYFQTFLSRNKSVLSPLVEKSIIEKTTIIVDGEQVSLECLPTTMAALNGPHEACELPETEILTDSGIYVQAEDLEIGDKLRSFSVISVVPSVTIVKSIKKTQHPMFRIEFDDGTTYTAAADHQVFTPHGWSAIRNLCKGAKTFTTTVIPEVNATVDFKPEMCLNFDSFLIGKIMGDAHISIPKAAPHRPCRIQFAHSKKQEAYYHHCVTRFEEVSAMREKKKVSGFGSEMFSATTRSLPAFEFLKGLFLDKNFKKTIKPELINFLTPEMLAYWFMDDGSATSALDLATCGFSVEENYLLVQMLKAKFGFKDIKVSIHKRGKYKKLLPILSFSVEDSVKLANLIYPYVIPEMQYKLNRIREKSAFDVLSGNKVEASSRGFHRDVDGYNNRTWLNKIKKLPTRKVVNRTYLGVHNTVQIEVEGNEYSERNYLVKGGIISHNCVVSDELDTLSPEGLLAYKQINGIPVKHRLTGAPPLKIGISTRKSAYGLVQKQMDTAEAQGRIIRMWNQIDLTEKCVPERHGKEEVTIYVKQDIMHHLPQEEWDKLTSEKQAEYIAYPATNGCLKCPLFSVCLGDLKNQDPGMTAESSTMISTITDVINRVKGADVDWVLAELMCLKPSLEGVVFKEFDKARHVASWDKMWEKLTGEKSELPVDEQKFVSEIHKRKIPVYAGVDFGWTAPSTICILAVDQKDNVYVLKVFGVTKTNDPTFINYIKAKFHRYYRIQMYYPDTASGSGVDLMKQAGLPVASKVDKSENWGVQIIKGLLNVPGTSETKIQLASETCSQMVFEMERYHYEKDGAGNVIDGRFAKEYDHSLDGLRYTLTAVLGRARFVMAMDVQANMEGPPLRNENGDYYRAPTFQELAREHSIPVFTPESKPFNRDGDEDEGPDSGFNWFF